MSTVSAYRHVQPSLLRDLACTDRFDAETVDK
jgi:hypothetical protein